MTAEFIKEHSMEECASQFDQELQDFEAKVNAITDINELNELEKVILEEHNTVDEHLRSVTYQLPKEVEFDGQKFNIKKISELICYFLNKVDVQWQYTLGMYQMVRFWKSENPEVVAYAAYDSTLRTLNKLTFKGEKEWHDILAVNEYLKNAHEDYSKDTSWTIFVSTKHNMIMDRQTILEKLGDEILDVEESVSEK